jgi:hypothetical protein
MRKCSTPLTIKEIKNQNYVVITPHPIQNSYHQYYQQQQMLAKIWGKRNTSILWVRMQVSATSMESNMEVPQKSNYTIP